MVNNRKYHPSRDRMRLRPEALLLFSSERLDLTYFLSSQKVIITICLSTRISSSFIVELLNLDQEAEYLVVV